MNQKIESQNGVLEDITACTTGRFCLSDDPKMMELKSHTPYLRTGACLSAAGVAAFAALIVITEINRKKKKQHPAG